MKLSNLYVIGILEEENEKVVEQMCINILLKNFQTQWKASNHRFKGSENPKQNKYWNNK